MASQTLSPTTAITTADLDVSWNNPTNSLSSNDTYATASLFLNGQQTDALRVATFGFTIPSLATVNGVTVEIERKSSMTNTIKDYIISIRKGTTDSNNKSTAAFWSTTESYVTFGGPADLWGLTLTPDEVNETTFAVNIRVTNETETPVVASVDHVRVTITYTVNVAGTTIRRVLTRGLNQRTLNLKSYNVN